MLAGDLFINEIMADNDTIIEDPDEAGAFEDWVEIYNPTAAAIDLGGMYLTDDVSDPMQWQFPAGSSVAAGGFLLIWADGEPEQGDDHASFKLSAGGETVALYDFDGKSLVDSLEFGAQVTDVSYGRSPDGSATLSVLTTPTPGAANSVVGEANLAPTANAGGPYSGTTADTISLSGSASVDTDGTIATYAWDLDYDGQYDDATGETASFSSTTVGTFIVGVQVTDDDGATSIDTGTITISQVGDEPSPWDPVAIDDSSAAFFDDTYVHEILITFEDADWYNTLYNSHATDADDPYFEASFVGDGIALDQVGVRFKGNSSFDGTGIKKSIKIDFDEYDEDNDALTFQGLKKLNLNNNYNDPTMLREKLFYDYASNFVDGVSRAVHTKVYINGEYYGLYTAVEQVDKTFTQSRFGDDEDGNLYKGTAADDAVLADPQADFGSDLTYLGTDQADYEDFYELKTNETANDYSQLIELIDVLNNTPSGELADAIEPLLDVDSTLTSLALNNLFVNLDSYSGAAHNYYLYDRDDTGQFTHLFWDVNESFGTFTQFVDRFQDPVEIDPFWLPVGTPMGPPGTPIEDESRPLAENLWAIDEYSTDYLRDLAQMLEEGFDVTSATARINELADLIRADVTADPNKQFTTAQFEQNLTTDVNAGMRTIYGLTSFIEDRSTYLASVLATYDLEPESVEIYINEIMADNDATIEDPDEADAFEDWIELYNPGTTSVDLSGFYLTDDAADPTQWQFPDGSTIDAGGYLVIWADGDADQGDDHASFKLSANGESVFLYNVDGTTLVDSITFGEQATDVSYGRFPNGSSTLVVLSAATPGAANTNDVIENVDPNADAGGPYNGKTGEMLTLDASGSTDSDGTIVSYAWDLDNDGQYDDFTGVTATYDATVAGTFAIGVMVTDDDGATSTDTAIVTVANSVVEPGSYVIVDTGQEDTYDDNGNVIAAPEPGEAFYGQDGQYDGVEFAFEENGDGTVMDLNTGLTWQQTPSDVSMSYEEALQYANSVELGGYDDWRLPTAKELFSLSNFSEGWPYIDTEYFDLVGATQGGPPEGTTGPTDGVPPEDGSSDSAPTDVLPPDGPPTDGVPPADGVPPEDAPAGETGVSKDEQYWATYYVGTTHGNQESAFGVNAATGHIKAYPAKVSGQFGNYVRLVRGDIYGENSFVDNGDGTVTDLATGLMWQQDDSGAGMDWEDSLEYAENLDLGGYDDWILPDIKQLQSILDYTQSPTAINEEDLGPAIDTDYFDIAKLPDGTTNTDSDYPYFWSSTSAYFGGNSTEYYYAWYASFGTAVDGNGDDSHGAGGVRFDTKVEGGPDGEGGERIYNFVRAVRYVGTDTTTNVEPTAEAGGPYTGTVGDTVALSGVASADTDGTIGTYAWDLDNDGQYDDATGVTATFDATTAGVFTVGLQVTDDDGATSTDTAMITVDAVVPAAGLRVTPSDGTTLVDENGASDTISVMLNSEPSADVVVTVTSADVGEVTVSPTTLTFTTENWSVAQVVTVTGMADGVADGSQVVALTFASTSEDPAYAALENLTVSATNENVETPSIPTQVFMPNLVVRAHVIPASSMRSAIIFEAFAGATLSVFPVGTASVSEIIRIVDENSERIDTYEAGSTSVTVVAGKLYAILFEAQAEQRIFTIRSTSGNEAFSPISPRNILLPTDTTGDGFTTASDALTVINHLNSGADQVTGEGETISASTALLDVSGDDRISALDSLIIINELNRPVETSSSAAEGEWVDAMIPQSVIDGSNQVKDVDDNGIFDEPLAPLALKTVRLVSEPLPNSGLTHVQLVDEVFGADDADHSISDNDIDLLASDLWRNTI
ncbi:CotH kinase family protein [Novipirellula artificiosorum]|uniref:Inner spore coat protein H n=1 Tax=Novipirellula artificiosorum TaxID=2528016 RepID=A0A5C6D8T0_9BACT|nr:CotH kinase family protein [Novipirellula artificiosorum]TWU32194.1 Inner spore coat protein H [Novipirellula artificiosorum]